MFTAIPKTAPNDASDRGPGKAAALDVIPKATKGTDVSANVGGQTAAYIDLADRISDKLPQMIAIVVGLSCIVLLLAFRSLLLPLKAAVANLLSVAAAYGVVTFVFQEGHGASLLGLDGAVPIASYVPLLMFAILFGLSMDYEVFLLTQIQEHYKKDGDPHEAVVRGLASTGRVITSAALIMVFVFASFVLNGNAIVKQFGVGSRRGDRDRRDDRALPCGARRDGAVRQGGMVAPRWLDRAVPESASRARTTSRSATGAGFLVQRHEGARGSRSAPRRRTGLLRPGERRSTPGSAGSAGACPRLLSWGWRWRWAWR